MPLAVSITSAIISWKWTDNTAIRGMLVAAIIVIGLAGYFVSQRLAERNVDKFKYKTPEGQLQIREAITKFISHGQDAAIFSRDLTWVNDEVLDMLKRKAISGELALFMPRPVPLSEALVESGAVAYYYGDLFSDPNSYDGIPRFTLVRPNTDNSELAFGNRRGDVHKIYYSRDSSDPALSLAKDIYRFIRHSVNPIIKTP
ncbi:hypothetical protein QWI29_01450 [Mycolicibacterium neoaurum]|uniref:hypothetical protein n=1 Tax=Mycolicibacterium neoaurum TaxID=1795 RepID=UPI002671E69D|nr:hypothetical protein [Mycolicibacterium neoaurum]MDO3398685.1 hypothetical protein [Mycolicibacterium neoaurum]